MSNGTRRENGRHYIGVDVGGTKIVAALVDGSGRVELREKVSTPREGGPEETLVAIEGAITTVLKKAAPLGLEDAVRAIGIAIPGVVDPQRGVIVVTPNMNLTGVDLRKRLKKQFDVPIALGNDCNLGALGEKWLGAGRGASSLVAILVGTGVGAGIVLGKKLWQGAHGAAAEIGHTVMQIGGPKCGCGNSGCLEALCSRTAMERDIRQAIANGEETIITDLLGGEVSVIRSGALRLALEQKDQVVTRIVEHAALVLGHLCLTVRHMLDPEVIVLGGGVMEACSDYMLPTIQSIIAEDQLVRTKDEDLILLSPLGDDAVLLGAVALALHQAGEDPFTTKREKPAPLPRVSFTEPGTITIGKKKFSRGILIRVNGKVRKWKNPLDSQPDALEDQIGRTEIARACRGGPEILFVGIDEKEPLSLTKEATQFLRLRKIECVIGPTRNIIKTFDANEKRKAGIFRVAQNET